ncbi:hypothetical protein [Acetobacter sp.]|uniref:hypothetical protein n=1 Tax=Acetobacter sp. TaxID=440 RepID=UPI0039ECF62A
MRSAAFMIVTLLGAFSFMPAARAETVSPQMLADRLTHEPWRYGGLSSGGKESLVIGLHGTGPTSLAGEFAQLDAQRRAVRIGALSGSITPPLSGVMAHCAFTVRFPDQIMSFEGACAPETLSGTIGTRKTPRWLSAQVANAFSPDASLGMYWLTASGFNAALSPVASGSAR